MKNIITNTIAAVKDAFTGNRVLSRDELAKKAAVLKPRMAVNADLETKIEEAKRKAREIAETMSADALNDDPGSMTSQAAAVEAIAAEDGRAKGWETHMRANSSYCDREVVAMIPGTYALYRELSALINANVETARAISRGRLAGLFSEVELERAASRTLLMAEAYGHADRRPSCSIGDPASKVLHPNLTAPGVIREYEAVEAAMVKAEQLRDELATLS